MSTYDSDDTELVLAAIQAAAHDMTGKTAPIDRGMRIDWYFDALDRTGEWDLGDLSAILEESLGVSISEQDWDYLTGRAIVNSDVEWEEKYAPLFTFGRLADLIAARLPTRDVPIVTILGARSKAAGAFRKIEQLAAQVDPTHGSFGPSTLIAERFRGRRLRKLWTLLRRQSESRIPPLDDAKYRLGELMFGSTGVRSVLMVALLVALLLGYFGRSRLGAGSIEFVIIIVFWAFLLAGPIGLLALVISRMLQRQGQSALPHGILTFRDLAELISGDRGGWCEKCGYDLTGLTSDRCPECGTSRSPSVFPTTESR